MCSLSCVLLTIIELLGGGHHSMRDNEQVSNSISDFDQVLSDIMAPTSDEKLQSRGQLLNIYVRGGLTRLRLSMGTWLTLLKRMSALMVRYGEYLTQHSWQLGVCQTKSKVVSEGTAQRPDVLILAGVALCVATLEGSGQGPFRCCSEI